MAIPIKRLVHNGNKFFPAVALDAVFDTNGTTLRTLLSDIRTTERQRTPVGSIVYLPVNVAGKAGYEGWMLCDGSAISRTSYADLFALLSTTYGEGNGSSTFNIPDFRGVFLRCFGERSLTQSWTDTSGTARSVTTTHASGAIGAVQGDAIRNITGSINKIYGDGHRDNMTGAFFASGSGSTKSTSSGWSGDNMWGFDASRETPVGLEDRPVNMPVNAYIRVF